MRYLIHQILILQLLLFNCLLSGQEFPPGPVFETKVKEQSELNDLSRSRGFDLVEIQSRCIDSAYAQNFNRLLNRLSSIERIENQLVLKVNTIEDCGLFFIGEIEVPAHDSIGLVYSTEGMPAKCYCYYELTYRIELDKELWVMEDQLVFLINGRKLVKSAEKYRTYPPQFEVVHGDTLNVVDKYGMRQGYWLQKDSLNRVVLEGVFHNAKDDYYQSKSLCGFTGRASISYYDNSNHIKSEQFRVNGYDRIVSRSYAPNGQIIKECQLFSNSANEITCREWDENGEEIVPQEGGN